MRVFPSIFIILKYNKRHVKYLQGFKNVIVMDPDLFELLLPDSKLLE